MSDTAATEPPALAAPAGRPRRRLAVLWESRWLGVAFIVALLVLWEIAAASGVMPAMSFPRMSAILATWWDLIVSGELLGELVPSLWRMFAGYFVGVALGVLVGLLMGYVRFFYTLLEPITEVLRPIPSPAYLPIVILFLGIDDEMKIFMIAFASFFPVLLNTYSGVRSVDPVQLQTARTFGVSGWKLLWQIVLPASSPYIFTGMRVSLAVALIVMVISEMVAASSGIGYFILSAQRGFKIREMFAGVLTLAALGYILNRLFLMIENRVLAWHYGTKNHPVLVAGDLSVTDCTAEQLRAAGVAKGGGPALAVPRGLEHGEAEAVVGTAIGHPAARDRLAAEIVLDLAGEQCAAGAEHELRAALVGEAQDLHHMDMAGQRERDAVGQLAVPVRQRLLQGGVDSAAPRTESPDRAVGEQPRA